ncbi:AzlD domain-containing protein [Lysobacter korlensis]|uniref:AzlD domain-containing protein n=1 Tax=Lysobacter korlensis TaxID=553636 RepID=A0ABV6RMI4_9GAMM
MTVWNVVLLASVVVLALKLSGYLVPREFVERPGPSRVVNLLTVALLAALVAVQTLGSGAGIAVDARVPALGVAGVLFALRVPFILVIVAAAATAALLRLAFGAA